MEALRDEESRLTAATPDLEGQLARVRVRVRSLEQETADVSRKIKEEEARWRERWTAEKAAMEATWREEEARVVTEGEARLQASVRTISIYLSSIFYLLSSHPS